MTTPTTTDSRSPGATPAALGHPRRVDDPSRASTPSLAAGWASAARRPSGGG